MISVFGCSVQDFFVTTNKLGASKVDKAQLRVEIGGEEYRLFTHAHEMNGCTFDGYEVWGLSSRWKGNLKHFEDLAKSRVKREAK